MSLHSQFADDYDEYLAYLNDGGNRVRVPIRPRSNRAVPFVSASNLGRCPRAAALKHHKVAPTHPLGRRERLSTNHLMQQGTRDAEPFQEAMLWKYGNMGLRAGDNTEQPWLGVKPVLAEGKTSGSIAEAAVEDKMLRVSGRVDTIVYIGGQLHIAEIKRRDAPQGKEHPEPRITDCYQSLAYSLITGITSTLIITVNRYFFNVWQLVPQDGGFILVNEDGEKWQSWKNSPEHLNFDNVRSEIALHLLYLDKEHTHTPDRYRDFLNEDEGWECYKWDGDKPKMYGPKGYRGKTERTSYIKRRCVYFCHDAMEQVEVRETSYDSGNFAIVPAEERGASDNTSYEEVKATVD